VAISVNRKSLPDHILKRHEISEQTSRDRWLNNLSEEDRNKLSEKDKKFSLRYTVLVSSKHVTLDTGSPKPNASSSSVKAESTNKQAESAEPKRLTTEELAAQEQAYLESIKSKLG
jgi:hypothetical protein